MQATTEDIEQGRATAETIMAQIGRGVLLSIGARRAVSYAYGDHDEATGFVRGGVQFTITQGHKVVRVLLNAMDLYDVRIINKRSGKVVGEAADVYCDSLQEVVYGLVSEAHR